MSITRIITAGIDPRSSVPVYAGTVKTRLFPGAPYVRIICKPERIDSEMIIWLDIVIQTGVLSLLYGAPDTGLCVMVYNAL